MLVTEDQLGGTSQIDDCDKVDENNSYSSENDSSSFSEYHVPLEQSIETGRPAPAVSGCDSFDNKDSSNQSLDNQFAATEGFENNFVEIDNQYDEIDDQYCNDKKPKSIAMDRSFSKQNPMQRPEHDSQHLTHDDSLTPTQQKRSGQSVSFKSSVEDGFFNDFNRTIVQEDCVQNTLSKQNRSMEIRMDGHVTDVTYSDDAGKATLLSSDSGNVYLGPPTANETESQRVASLYWVDSNEGPTDDDVKNNYRDRHYISSKRGIDRPSKEDVSLNTTTSVPPISDRLTSRQNNVLTSSSEGTLPLKASSFSNDVDNSIGAQGGDEGNVLSEENVATGISFDESDASNTTRTGFTRRFKKTFNFYKISILIVKWMSYICLCCFRNRNERGSAFPDRFILARLNILSFFFSAIQLAASIWLIVIVFVEGRINDNWGNNQHQVYLWNNNGTIVVIGCLAFILVLTCFWTTRIVKEVDLVGALRFLWLLLWILPIAIFLNITAFDYHGVTSIWIRHSWNGMQLWWFRKHFCLAETAESLCMVPIQGGVDFESEDEWCIDRYNSTRCTAIRDEAQEKSAFFLLSFYRSLASWGCIYMFIMLLIIKSLERIISKPMVQKSREVNVVGWLTFPVLCTALFGSVFLFTPFSYLDKLVQPRWVGYLYFITSGLFMVALLMGWFISAFSIRSNVDKQNKSNAALILVVVLFINSFVLLAILMASIIWSQNLKLSDEERGAIACTINNSQCTNCDAIITSFRCPEWNVEEITNIVRRELMQSAVMAAIFILYDLNVMIRAFNLRKHLSMYQIDYV